MSDAELADIRQEISEKSLTLSQPKPIRESSSQKSDNQLLTQVSCSSVIKLPFKVNTRHFIYLMVMPTER